MFYHNFMHKCDISVNEFRKKYNQYKTRKQDIAYVIFSHVSKFKCLNILYNRYHHNQHAITSPILMENSDHMSRIRQSNAEHKVKVNSLMF